MLISYILLQVVTELDAFPKVEETYVEQTATGASGHRAYTVHLGVILYISGFYCTFRVYIVHFGVILYI